MKETFEKATVEVIEFNLEDDIVTASPLTNPLDGETNNDDLFEEGEGAE